MRIAVTGSGGQLGGRLVSDWTEAGHEAAGLDLPDFDLGRFADVAGPLLGLEPDVIVHTAAYTDVDGCEENPELADDINWFGTRAVAGAASRLDALMVYISTDYVFDGVTDRPYTEAATPAPGCRYGASKRLGEEEVRRLCPRHIILRTCGLYGPMGRNFAKSILRVLGERGRASVVDDQFVSPTYVKDLARAVDAAVEAEVKGTFHAVNRGPVSWFEFARRIAELAGFGADSVRPTTTSALGRRAARPAFSALDSGAFERASGFAFRTWEQALEDFLTNDFPPDISR